MSTEDLVGACYEPEAGYADPVAATMAFAHQARRLGAQIRQHTRVAALLVEGGRIRGVRLEDETEVEARAVIVAANIWGVALLRAIGLDLPVHASRHPCVLFQQPPGFGPQHPILLDFSNGLYLKPEGADLTLAGTLDELEDRDVDPDRYNTLPTHEEMALFADRTARRLPAMADATLQSGYAGIYDVSADWQPFIDEVPGITGLFCALGFSGHGFKLSPVVGELVADMVRGRSTPGIDRDVFRIDRFATGATARSRYAYGIIG
jgi:sarcosine oxidase subunit beta